MHGIADRNGIRLDPHALLQGNLRQLQSRGGELHTGAARCRDRTRRRRLDGHEREGRASSRARSWSTPPAPGPTRSRSSPACGRSGSSRSAGRSSPSTRRPAPSSTRLPFAKTVGDELYFAPESGRLFASPMDEVPSEPCDAQPDEYEVALAAYRMEERTIVKVERIHSRWAGLRTFTPDRHPAVGFAPDAEGFFWLAGQGGFGLQTSPAMAAIAASLIAGSAWPVADVGRRGAKPRPLPPAGGIGRPSARRRARTAARSGLRPRC